MPSLNSYSDLHRPIGPSEIRRAEKIFALILDEMKDCPNTNEMFKEYGMVANFVLSNRQIAYKLADELQQGST